MQCGSFEKLLNYFYRIHRQSLAKNHLIKILQVIIPFIFFILFYWGPIKARGGEKHRRYVGIRYMVNGTTTVYTF